jgi:hypothetical protein
MSKLHGAYNTSVLKFLRWLYKAFHSNKALYDECARVIEQIKNNANTTTIFEELDTQMKTFSEPLYASDCKVFDCIDMLQRIEMHDMYDHMTESERENFWRNLTALAGYGGMLRACGGKLQNMESMAAEYIQENKGRLDPQRAQQQVFEDIFSGGKFTKQLLGMYKNTDDLKNVFDNFGDLLRLPGQEKVDLSGLTAMIEEEDISNLSENFDDMKKEMEDSGISFDALFQQAQEGLEISENPTDCLQSIAQIQGIQEALQKLAAKAKGSKGVSPPSGVHSVSPPSGVHSVSPPSGVHNVSPTAELEDIPSPVGVEDTCPPVGVEDTCPPVGVEDISSPVGVEDTCPQVGVDGVDLNGETVENICNLLSQQLE